MKKEKLIEQLQKLPGGIEVCIYDWRKNFGDDDGDGSGTGVYDKFDIAIVSLEPDEAEYFADRHEREFVPWAAMGFNNEDYNDDGILLTEL